MVHRHWWSRQVNTGCGIQVNMACSMKWWKKEEKCRGTCWEAVVNDNYGLYYQKKQEITKPRIISGEQWENRKSVYRIEEHGMRTRHHYTAEWKTRCKTVRDIFLYFTFVCKIFHLPILITGIKGCMICLMIQRETQCNSLVGASLKH